MLSMTVLQEMRLPTSGAHTLRGLKVGYQMRLHGAVVSISDHKPVGLGIQHTPHSGDHLSFQYNLYMGTWGRYTVLTQMLPQP